MNQLYPGYIFQRPEMPSGGGTWDQHYSGETWGVKMGQRLESEELYTRESEKWERDAILQTKEGMDRRHVFNGPTASRSTRQTLFPGYMQPSVENGVSPINSLGPYYKTLPKMDVMQENCLRNMHVVYTKKDAGTNGYFPSSTGSLYNVHEAYTSRPERHGAPERVHPMLFSEPPQYHEQPYADSFSAVVRGKEGFVFNTDTRQQRRTAYK